MRQPLASCGFQSVLRLLESGRETVERSRFSTGMPELDSRLGGGLERGVLHEIYGDHSACPAAASGFGLGLALRAAERRPLVWVRHDLAEARMGRLHGDGLAAFGLDPTNLVVVRARDAKGALRAVDEAVRCTGLGAALVDVWGTAQTLDLKVSRRLLLAARTSGVTVFMMRFEAEPRASAAATRWRVSGLASRPLEAKAPGRPAFAAALLRDRRGLDPSTWHLEWDRDSLRFSSPGTLAGAPLSRPVVSLPAVGPGSSEGDARWRRAV